MRCSMMRWKQQDHVGITASFMSAEFTYWPRKTLQKKLLNSCVDRGRGLGPGSVVFRPQQDRLCIPGSNDLELAFPGPTTSVVSIRNARSATLGALFFEPD